MRSAFYLYLSAHFGMVLLLGLTGQIRWVADGGPSTALIPNLLPTAMMTGRSAVGAALHSDRNRALHLVAWLAVLVAVIGRSALTIG